MKGYIKMKAFLTGLLMTVVATGMAFGQAPKPVAPAASSASVSDELKQIENDWMAAAKTKDAAKLGAILADSWIGLEWDGRINNKAKALADLKVEGNSLDTIEMGEMTVRTFGNTAVVTGSDVEKSKEKGKDTSGKYIWTDVFVKTNGKWQAVSSQSAKVPK
jgi:ketosteroid isomerase-like protein